MKMLCNLCMVERPFIILETNNILQEDGSKIGYSKYKMEECNHIVEMTVHCHEPELDPKIKV